MSWNDANRNYYPDCNLGNFSANGECGALNDQNFGRQNPRALQWSDAVREGWGVRDNNWDMAAEVQHEVSRGLSLNGGYYFNNGGYYRNVDSIQRSTDNELVGPNDYDQFCVTAPIDARLPNGGGYQICGLSAIKPSAFGLAQPVVKRTKDFGQDIRRNHFYGIGATARLPQWASASSGGFDAGKITKDQCFVVDTPGLAAYSVSTTTVIGGVWGPQNSTTINGEQTCKQEVPFKGLAMLKTNGSVPLAKEFTASFVYTDQAGPPIDAVWAAPNAAIAPSLGRNLAGNAATQTVPLVVANSLFEDRIRRLDLRLSKYFNLPRKLRLQVNLDAYNALNTNAVQTLNNTFGANWLQPLTIMDPRILQFSGQLTF